ncbi:hypothetical protein SAMN02745116_01909 [Pilibacter termitis]|uniref:Uncharacterized protein n=1 Tax=Pilibacter termitis TaxID=263852 RepID=A0A1T4PSQ4_9ENTE|nr:hypothetical protein [Pilibacter termitis]SJZ94306.1 hypothetical protein SAMN02745116_01909 [Pilibacter termitis]
MNDNQLQIQGQGEALFPTQNSFTQTGDKNLQVVHADIVENHKHETMVINTGTAKEAQAMTNVATSGMNHDFYNLIVWGSDEISDNYVTIDKSRALTEYMTESVFAAFTPLTANKLSEVFRMPTIITSENHYYGYTDDDHMAKYGLITDIREVSSGFRIYFNKLNEIPQQRLNELSEELDLWSTTHFTEFNRSHWSIKNIDLVTELKKAGIPVLSM